MALEDLPPLGSAELEALLLAPMDEQGGYQLLNQPAPWLLDPSPAGSGDPLFNMPVVDLSMVNPADVSSVPEALPDHFLDPFLSSLPDPLMPMLPLGAADTFVPLPLQASSDELGGGGSGSAATSSGGGVASAAAHAAAAPARRGKGGGKKELTQEQVERIRAKNRKAQNRYREKQKAKAAAAEKEYHDTAAELARMRLENARLQEHNSAMTQVLTVRETAMELLQKGKAADEEAAAAAAAGSPETGDSAAPSHPALAAQAGAAALCAVQPGDLAAEGKEGGGKGGSKCPLTGLTLSQIAELKKTPPEVLQQRWKGLAQRLEILLQQKEAAASSADPSLAHRSQQLDDQMEETLFEGQAFCFEHAIYQPTSVQKLFAAALDDGRSQTSAEDMRHWEAVASAVRPSPAQLERLAAVRTKFLNRIAQVCGERRAIFERLQAVQVPTSLKALQQVTASWLKVHEATSELTANMTEEHCVCMSFVRDAFGYVLTPQQKAVAIVRSYPYFPDMYSITTAALQAAGALEAGDERRLLTAPPPAAPADGGAPVAVAAQ